MSAIVPWNDGYSYRRQIGPRAENRAAVDFLAEAYPHSSAAEWTRRLKQGEVELDERPCEAETRLRRGAWLVWHRPPWFEAAVQDEHRTLFEDASILVVEKPAGLQTLPAGGRLTQTLLHRIRRSHLEATPAHRLGRHTSGLLVFGKTPAALRELSGAFRNGRVERVYRAWGAGSPAEDRFRIDAPIGLVHYAPIGELHAATPSGRSAATSIRVIRRQAQSFLAEVTIHSGRPHQIRIHLACAGHPLVGDPLYIAGGRPRPGGTARPGDGGYRLHAARLAFPHPEHGRRVEFESAATGILGGETDG